MQIYYNGADISPDVSIAYARAVDCEGGRADSVDIGFTDVEALWARWQPRQGDEIRIREEQYDSGIMYVDGIVLERDRCNLRAFSVPPDIRMPSWQAWESVTLKKVAAEICERHGLELSLYGVPDTIYPRLKQDGQCDIDYLAYRCMLEGCALKLMGKRAVIYDVKRREASEPVRTLDIEGALGYRYEDRASDRLASYTVISGSEKATCTDPSGSMCRGGARTERDLPAFSQGEAERYAYALLREHNKTACTLRVSTELNGIYAAGETINVEGNLMAAGKWMISAVEYDFMRKAATLTLRRCLTW